MTLTAKSQMLTVGLDELRDLGILGRGTFAEVRLVEDQRPRGAVKLLLGDSRQIHYYFAETVLIPTNYR